MLVIIGLVALGGITRAKAAVPPAAAAKPVVEVNLIDFDPALGDVHARLHLRLPSSMLLQDEAPAKDLVFVDAANIDESILKIPSKEPFSAYDDFINTRYQVNDPGSQFMYPFDEHETDIHFFLAEDDGSTNLQHIRPIPIAYDCSNCSFDGFQVAVTDAGTTPTEVRL